jgi:hypothetical protein
VRSALAAVTSSGSSSSSADITAAAAAAVAALDEHTEHAISTGSVLAGVGNAAVLCVATFVMMRFFRLVIHERDLYLARAIQVRQPSITTYPCKHTPSMCASSTRHCSTNIGAV